MNRRKVLSLAAIAASTRALPHAVRAQRDDFESGGLGLPLSAWEDTFGPGEAGQTYMSFQMPDGNYWIGVSGESRLVDYIERNWSEGAGATLAEAQDEASSHLPADAKRVERFIANYAQILHGSQIDRYQSRSLGDLFEDRGKAARSFVVLYELVPAEAAFDYVVTRHFVTVGSEPASGE